MASPGRTVGEAEPVSPAGPHRDNPPLLLGPAGTVHCSMVNWGRYVATHQGDDQAATVCDEAASALIEMHPGRGNEGAGEAK